MSWYGGRKYEHEYTLARRIGKIVSRKMITENTKIVRLRVRSDNELTNWFTSSFLSYTTSYGGWCASSSRKCFRSELYYGWLREQPDDTDEELYNRYPVHTFLVVRSKYTLLFLDVRSLKGNLWRTFLALIEELVQLETLAHAEINE